MGHVYVLGVMYMCYGSCICVRGIDFASVSTIFFLIERKNETIKLAYHANLY